MKKKSVSFWCLGNLEAISFLFLFSLTFTVQPPSVSRQRCHMNIRSGRCYLTKEERNKDTERWKLRKLAELGADSAVALIKKGKDLNTYLDWYE